MRLGRRARRPKAFCRSLADCPVRRSIAALSPRSKAAHESFFGRFAGLLVRLVNFFVQNLYRPGILSGQLRQCRGGRLLTPVLSEEVVQRVLGTSGRYSAVNGISGRCGQHALVDAAGTQAGRGRDFADRQPGLVGGGDGPNPFGLSVAKAEGCSP
jgi:hypothetical protein